MIGLNKIGLNQVQLNRLRLNAPFPAYGKMAGGGGSGDGFPQLPGDVTRWHFGGLTNEMMAAMDDPRIEDADHKGRFLSFKNFAWGGMSGVGGYVENYNNNRWFINSTIDAIKNGYSFKITQVKQVAVQIQYISLPSTAPYIVPSYRIKVTGLTDGQTFSYRLSDGANFPIVQDGVYELPEFEFSANGGWFGFQFNKVQESCNITIEQLPLYPGFILGDGVDDFAVTEKELNFEDTYTVYTAFIPFQNNPARNMILCGADSKKTFSMQYSSLVYVSFIAGNNYYINADFVNGLNLFACKRNGNNICIKNLLTNKVVTGTCGDWVENAGLYYLWKNATYASFARAGIAGQIIDNGHFTTDEEDENILNWHKKQYPWLFPDQAWTVTGKTNEDEDRATIANITGNGNDLVLSNFGFAEGSGYNEEGEYAGYLVTDGVDDKITSSTFEMGNDWTVIGDWELINTGKNVNAGIVKFNSIVIYNYNPILINIKNGRNNLIPDQNTVNAICSDGRIYSKDWKESIYNEETESTSKNLLTIGYSGNSYTKIAFKNLAIYPTVLSKEDCIKAYNYLQTLKAK